MSLTCVLGVVDLQLFCCRCNFALFQLFSNFADDDDDNDGNYDDDDDNYVSIYDDDDGKGTPHLKKNVFFRALPKLPLPPLPFFRATCTFFSDVIKVYIKCIF